MKITDKIYLVGGSGFGYSAPGDCNIYMIDCESKLALVHTGGGRGIPEVLENVERMVLIQRILRLYSSLTATLIILAVMPNYTILWDASLLLIN